MKPAAHYISFKSQFKGDLQLICQFNSLLYLYTAVGAGKADHQLKLFGGILHKLTFEGFLFSTVSPAQSLDHIYTTVQTATQGDKLPAHGFPDLLNKTIYILAHVKAVIFIWSKFIHWTNPHQSADYDNQCTRAWRQWSKPLNDS